MTLRMVEYGSLLSCGGSRQWNGLVDLCPDATIFQRFEWIDSWWQTFRREDWKIRIFAAYESGQLVGLAPFYERCSSEKRSPSLHLLGEEHADYACVISRAGGRHIISALLRHVTAVVARRTRIYLDEVPRLSNLRRVLEDSCHERPLHWVRVASTPCPWVAVRENTDATKALLSKKSLRRHRMALSRLGRLSVSHEYDATKIQKHLPKFFEQHVSRWSLSSYPSLFNNDLNQEFYRKLVVAFGPSRKIIFTTLMLDGCPIAYHFGFLSNSKLLWYKPTFDVRFSRYSPGEVLLGALIEYALDHDLVALDFTRGDERFKNRFASKVSYNDSYVRFGWPAHAIKQRICDGIRTNIRQFRCISRS